jgi:hypothetical protein
MFELLPKIGQKCLWVVPQKTSHFYFTRSIKLYKIIENTYITIFIIDFWWIHLLGCIKFETKHIFHFFGPNFIVF